MRQLTFYLDFISPYAYLAFHALPKTLQGLSYQVSYQPILFGAVLQHHGQLGPAEIEGKREWTYRQVLWLAQQQACPLRMPASHPFNPVYLLPLSEVSGSPKNPPEVVAKTVQIMKDIGMFPLVLKKEIDAFIGNRFLEAVWREALWMLVDGVATTSEIDDAIRMGFGLRWGQMGLFETYRVAGGEAGMRHFMAQFGPALKWPWTKLMDVPEFNDALVDLVATQSDAQSGAYGIRELERIRDQNLIGFLRALKERNWGAGKVLLAHDAARAAAFHSSDATPKGAPLVMAQMQVLPGWIDYNGHMTESRYYFANSETVDAFLRLIGAGMDYVSLAVVLEEIAAGDGGTSTVISVTNCPVNAILMKHGNAAQQAEWLTPLARGDMLGAFCLTEPHVGSDASGLRTTAVRDGDHYVLTGVKQFITSGQNGDVAIVRLLVNELRPFFGKHGLLQ